MLSVINTTTRLVVRYYFMGPITRYIHTAKFGNEDDLNKKPKLKQEWEDRNKEFSKTQGPDDAGATVATMSTPHTGGSNPSEPNHTTTAFENDKGQRLVRQDGDKVISKEHVYEDPKLWKKYDYRVESATEKQAREAREQSIREKKAILKAEKLKEKKANDDE